MRGQKDEQRAYHEKVQELEDKLCERDQEQNLVKHRLIEIQEQGNRIKKDQADTLAHRDKLLYTHKQLLQINNDVQSELDYMIRVDKNLSCKLDFRNKQLQKTQQLVQIKEEAAEEIR